MMKPKAKRTSNAAGGIRVLAPDDTGVRKALREPPKSRPAVSYAVQLLWSVQPIDPAGVPALDILRAYTLYTTESSRAVPKWYALRLGFFSNAISAQQVALYLRSHFTSVAVIPIGETERRRALGEASPGEKATPTVSAAARPDGARRGDNVRLLSIDVQRTPEFRRLLARLREWGDPSRVKGRGR